MYSDDELLPISALQHYTFCPRRAALVHVERAWADNRFTAEGNVLHAKAHDPRRGESRPGVRIARGLELRSYRHGLTGRADVVEFYEPSPVLPDGRVLLVEYKRGRPKESGDTPFRVQLCAQAFCLEEMMEIHVSRGSLFFGQARRRHDVVLDASLREETETMIQALRQLVQSGETPRQRYQPKCRRCSMVHLCMPKALRPRATAARYLAKILDEDPSELP